MAKHKCVSCEKERPESKMYAVDWCCNDCNPSMDRGELWAAVKAIGAERDRFKKALEEIRDGDEPSTAEHAFDWGRQIADIREHAEKAVGAPPVVHEESAGWLDDLSQSDPRADGHG